jgi:hypothetical protein
MGTIVMRYTIGSSRFSEDQTYGARLSHVLTYIAR